VLWKWFLDIKIMIAQFCLALPQLQRQRRTEKNMLAPPTAKNEIARK